MFTKATSAIVKVGGGRGFIIEAGWQKLVITAAHCLPSFPPAFSFSDPQERSYTSLLSSLNGEPSTTAQCLFVDPISDLAVLGQPDQEMWDHIEAFDALVDPVEPLSIAEADSDQTAWMLSLDNNWFACRSEHIGGPLWLSNNLRPIEAGMSGSPVLNDKGLAIGVVCCSTSSEQSVRHGPNPRLMHNFPRWLLP